MKHQQIIGPHIWNGIPGQVILETTDNAPSEEGWSAITIHDLKENINNLGGSKSLDPITYQPYDLDLSLWTHLNDEAELWMTWKFVADTPILLSDPRHPRNYKGNILDLILP
jgi:hypothetical protein